MGVIGLTPRLKPHLVSCNIGLLKGSVAAVDISVWVHLGMQGDEGVVAFIMKRLKTLQNKGIIPIAVLDGAVPPAKEATCEKRRTAKQKKTEAAKIQFAKGEKEKGKKMMAQAKSRTPGAQQHLIKVFNELKIAYVIAPYEADSQIAFLEKIGVVDVVVTIDSDFVVLGCKKVFYEMDSEGDGLLYDQDSSLQEMLGAGYLLPLFRWSCIPAGNDYIGLGVRDWGMTKSFDLYNRAMREGIADPEQFLDFFLSSTDLVENAKEFRAQFWMCENAFLHQIVYDFRDGKMIPWNPYKDGMTSMDMPYCGDPEAATAMSTLDLSKLESSTLIRNVYFCDYCNFSTAAFDDLKDHRKQIHFVSFVPGEGHKCEICGQIFAKVSSLKRHSIVHTGLKPFKCDQCPHAYTTEENLLAHQVSKHQKVDAKTFTCGVCQKEFAYSASLTKHMQTHKDERKYACETCGKTFNTTMNLGVHRRTHLAESERPYKCPTCGKGFNLSADVRRHMVVHSKEKPFVCPKPGCDTRFSRKGGLDRHIREQHDKIPRKENAKTKP